MAITPLPLPPSRQDPTNFGVRADEFLGALPAFATEANALAADVSNKQVIASNAATTATTQANNAGTSANNAATSAQLADDWANKTTGTVGGSEYSAKEYAVGTLVPTGSAKDWAIKVGNTVDGADYSAKHYAQEAELLTEKYQGALLSDPALDKSGNPLEAGDWYVNTTTGYIRAYNGSSWVQGISSVAGVSSVNGETGDVIGVVTENATQTLTNKILTNPLLLLGDSNGMAGQVPVSQGDGLPPVWGAVVGAISDYQELTSSGTWTKPSSATLVYVEAIGGGGGGRGATAAPSGGGGGGGFASKIILASTLSATESVVIGAGGAGGLNTNGADGGDTSFGVALVAKGGTGGKTTGGLGGGIIRGGSLSGTELTLNDGMSSYHAGGGASGAPGATSSSFRGGSSIMGGGGGGGGGTGAGTGGVSQYAGNGGAHGGEAQGGDGDAPGGGGGGSWSTTFRGGNGAPGRVRVWCW